MTYKRILVGADGSPASLYSADAALAIAARLPAAEVLGCHVYAARLHRTRFEEMEPGLPGRYAEEERLAALRSTHEGLITDGMALISDAYLTPIAAAAAEQGIPFDGVTPEGRNYVELLRAAAERQADLAVVGATGLGAVPALALGSCAERLLHHAGATDLLVMRQPWALKGRPIVVGVDGSDHGYHALERALQLAQAFETTVAAVAVYDPFFHTGVFRTIAGILPEAARERFDFAAQERLHDEIIDRGLERLYRANLERARPLADSLGVPIETEVVAGRVCLQLHHYAALKNAGLLVVGRYGLHREAISTIGGNALNAVRMSDGNVLVVAPSDGPVLPPRDEKAGDPQLAWTAGAEDLLGRVPSFARPMARAAIEARVRERGASEVIAEDVRALGRSLGMGG